MEMTLGILNKLEIMIVFFFQIHLNESVIHINLYIYIYKNTYLNKDGYFCFHRFYN